MSQSTVVAKGGNKDANFGVGDVTDEASHTNLPAVKDSQDQVRIEQRAKRRCFTYSKRKVLADCQLFIKDDEVVEWRLHKWNNWGNHRIMGQITGCPTKKNCNGYTLKWEIEHVEGMDSSWVKTTVRGTAKTKELLREAVEHYDKLHGKSGMANLPDCKPHVRNKPSASSPNNRSTVEITTPPTVVRAQAAANLVTCARSFASSVSSLT